MIGHFIKQVRIVVFCLMPFSPKIFLLTKYIPGIPSVSKGLDPDQAGHIVCVQQKSLAGRDNGPALTYPYNDEINTK